MGCGCGNKKGMKSLKGAIARRAELQKKRDFKAASPEAEPEEPKVAPNSRSARIAARQKRIEARTRRIAIRNRRAEVRRAKQDGI